MEYENVYFLALQQFMIQKMHLNISKDKISGQQILMEQPNLSSRNFLKTMLDMQIGQLSVYDTLIQSEPIQVDILEKVRVEFLIISSRISLKWHVGNVNIYEYFEMIMKLLTGRECVII